MGLFDGKELYQGGLTFTNTATGLRVPRDVLFLCWPFPFGKEELSWATRDYYATLHPE